MTTLAQLLESADGALVPVTPFDPSRAVTGVHVSELAAPGRYLAGGELLLTTGIPVTGGPGDDAYVSALAEQGIGALGLGLGEGWDAPPPGFAARCREAGIPLFVVPDGVPFLAVSRALTALERRVERDAGLRAASAHTRLAEAAARDEPHAAIVRTVAEAVGGWAAWVPASPRDGAAHFHPPGLSGLLPSVVADVQRSLRRSGVAAASFAAHGAVAVVFPVEVRGRTAGALAIGSGRPLSRVDRQLALTATALLRAGSAFDRGSEPAEWVARLAFAGEADAARALAREAGVEVPRVVRVTVAGAEAPPHPLSIVEDGRRLALVEVDDLPQPGATSAPVPLAEVAVVAARTIALHGSTPPGVSVVEPDDRAAAWLAVLTPELRTAVRAHLAEGRRIEQTARHLGVHRNTVRQRVAAAERAMGASLADPDVAAELWIALRPVSR
ncbi:PucR family transcriptional regulator [Microbacterium oleivorans]|uniref:PucR family transcriptional regulator ligand-binding domain-containing protein n=1 Tax=Microbacterium oleivorans TaxID=273677 RepID=A0A7D5F8N1_9MICO|nr:PucR family transcriptional regulator [Microbacterium oleivorans]QLD11629.1 PucR family transcriptional regulator ligand-binding domain-containing protein [Microbacterium oleivorans]